MFNLQKNFLSECFFTVWLLIFDVVMCSFYYSDPRIGSSTCGYVSFYHGPCRYDGTWSTHGNSSSSSFQPSNEPIRAHQMPQSSSVIGWMNWNITRLILLTKMWWGCHAMRKQRKSQLNQLASSSSSLLLASVVIRTTNKTFGPIEILARYRNSL